MRKAINKAFTTAGLILASTVVTLVVSPSPAGAEQAAGDSPAVMVLAGGSEWA
ncbi:hypothetical protein GCM10010112_59780 [Actinoplanes lobatus]|uniref:Uncharacterized protein n=1 Tax=Actinoplanes lobatus TaxID=113568 RepID=A0A7W7HQV5_9ACTN|nr:hypothetical protein [Actinoplanes lobatus]MBB4755038.1 hypothetical protein [Actinoplanes lobatus]GGN82399.1 hypothetical protein GCM10010112_59780 [Actinoplanes lobatus]GIE40644.1 hypothetical protein Alo02nite_35420 [Actinoplanes lobatus]